MKTYISAFVLLSTIMMACNNEPKSSNNDTKSDNATLFKHVTLIDGNGGAPIENTDILVQGDSVAAIGPDQHVEDATEIDLKGKTVMPAITSTHVHVGNLKGTSANGSFYTRENILRQLKQYEDYGVTNILVMGTDRPMLFQSGLRDSSLTGLLPGARYHSAGYGFGVPNGAPPLGMSMDMVFRPTTAADVAKDMDSVATVKPDVIKMWVDDFGGKFPKMDPSIYKAIIDEAHKRDLRVASHVYYLDDARKLVADGVDILAHSIRDKIIDDTLIQQMKAKNVMYIPTLSLDEFAYIYARKADWINETFFKKSLEPGVFEMITSQKYQDDLRKSPDLAKNEAAFQTVLRNVKKLHDAGILICLGTDSGATPIRVQGFSEHLEMELLVQAGLTPLQAITVATKNAATLLKIDDKFGTIEKGKTADFIVLDANPVGEIKNTRKIFAVYKAGEKN